MDQKKFCRDLHHSRFEGNQKYQLFIKRLNQRLSSFDEVVNSIIMAGSIVDFLINGSQIF